MSWHLTSRRVVVIVGTLLLGVDWTGDASGQQTPQRFGGAYAGLDERRQQLVGDWVARVVLPLVSIAAWPRSN
jgi:hypothetical protein